MKSLIIGDLGGAGGVSPPPPSVKTPHVAAIFFRSDPLRPTAICRTGGKMADVSVEIPLADFLAHVSNRFSSAQLYQAEVINVGDVR